jgi:PTH1 family peptidyl-tRNA hydrolase
LRVGIEPTPEHWETSDYVLSKFTPAERAVVDDGIENAINAAVSWLSLGIDAAMNGFNRDSQPPKKSI